MNAYLTLTWLLGYVRVLQKLLCVRTLDGKEKKKWLLINVVFQLNANLTLTRLLGYIRVFQKLLCVGTLDGIRKKENEVHVYNQCIQVDLSIVCRLAVRSLL